MDYSMDDFKDDFLVGATLAGAGASAYGQYMAGRQEQAVASYNARLMKQRARATEQAMESETERMHEQARRMKGAQRAAFAKSGAQITSGTPLLVMAEQAGEMERDILEHRRTRMIEAQLLRYQAQMMRWQGQQAKRAATIGAVSTMLGGTAKAGSLMT